MQKAKYFSLDMPRHGSPVSAHTPTQALFARACAAIPGGVNSPVRAYQAVGTTPRFIRRAQGAYVWDTEGERYIDYVGSWGPAILGHAHPEVVRAVQQATLDGLSFGAPTEAEVLLAETLSQRLPALEQVRLVNSGTEATMSAIRLARGYTGRTQIIKFEGCYHGHADSLLVQAGSGLLTLGTPDSAGVPAAFVEHTVVLPYNDLDAVRQVFARQGAQVAGVIVEPVAGNMNLVRPAPGFLQGLRELCTQHGAVLIFDEVMTGFRVGPQGAQGLFDITPDLTTLGKVIGGGMPLAAYGGRRDIMAKVSPLGPVYQAGTLAGNPVAVAAGLATLALIAEPGFHSRLASRTQRLVAGLRQAAERAGVAFTADAVGGMFGMYFQRDVPACLAQARQADTTAFAAFFRACLAEGVYFAPSAFEAGFVSIAHDDALVDQTLKVASRAFQTVAAHTCAADAAWIEHRERA